MNRLLAVPVVLAGALAISGCNDSSSSSDNDSGPVSQVRIIHASPDAPPVNVLVDDEVAVEAADYKQAAVLNPEAGSYQVAVEGIVPGGNVTVIGPVDFTFEENVRYNVVAVGEVGGIAPVVFEDEPGFSSSDEVRVRIGHLAPNAPNVDIYVTAAGDGDDLSAVDPLLVDVPFETVAEPVEVIAGDYRIQVTTVGSADPVFDSGRVTLPAGADLFVGAVQNTGANLTDSGASPVSLMVVNGADVSEIFDVDQGAGVRAVHNSANAPEVDVLVDDVPTLTGIAFGETAPAAVLDGYAALAGGDYNVKVTPAGATTPVVLDEDLTLDNGQGYSVLAVGLIDDADTPIEALVLEDSVRSIATQASLRVVHGSTQAGNVNIYLLPEGQDEIGNAEPALADVPYKAVTDYLPIPEGTYNLRVTDLDGNVAISADNIGLDNGGVYTVIARDGEDGNGSVLTDFGLILLDDFITAI
ncbi:DUF4397 domain-containing protein [Marinobacter zhanjiangensis]|uniref:DUF4397 domain-containing protein n=1 Tax=Marinobacter zhanjiangensis TaxID=578215 RepID=A0ABQ3AK46_9GAMM|nr:DUF4397 domain-containing protein [Marinobacter zhanjiangensis]GGY59745.1 hypothetical protein GCM10007071_02670 [Marinobacter zhanjiangensis]